MATATTSFTADELRRIAEYADNITTWLGKATKEQYDAGLAWYPRAAALALQVAEEVGLQNEFEMMAMVIAVLSPSVSWANQVKFTAPFVKAVLAGADPRSVKAPFYGANKVKAARILDGDTSALSGVKVEAFYRNILGYHDEVTVDRHALRIALNRDIDPESCKTLLRRDSKERKLVVEAYNVAAAQADLPVALVQAITWVVWRGKAD